MDILMQYRKLLVNENKIFLTNEIEFLLDSLYSPEITEAAARSHGQSLRQQNAYFVPQYSSTNEQIPQHETMMMVTPTSPHNDQFQSKLFHI